MKGHKMNGAQLVNTLDAVKSDLVMAREQIGAIPMNRQLRRSLEKKLRILNKLTQGRGAK